MGQLRVAKDEWDKLDDKAKEARKIRLNEVFLNEPALIDNEYVWDDHRLTDDHTFILDECRKEKPTKSEKSEDVLARIQLRVEGRKNSRITEEMVSPPLERRPKSPVSSPQDAESTNSEAIKEVDK